MYDTYLYEISIEFKLFLDLFIKAVMALQIVITEMHKCIVSWIVKVFVSLNNSLF